MNLEQVKQFALAVGTKVENHSGDWAACCCPLAPFTHDSGRDSHPSFAIRHGDNLESIFNCLAGETKVATRQGYVPIVDLVDRGFVSLFSSTGR